MKAFSWKNLTTQLGIIALLLGTLGIAISALAEDKYPNTPEWLTHFFGELGTAGVIAGLLSLIFENFVKEHYFQDLKSAILVEAKATLDSLERAVHKQLSADKGELDSKLDSQFETFLRRLGAVGEIQVFSTDEDLYTDVVLTIKTLENTTRDRKRLLHGILHHTDVPPRVDAPERPHFKRFVEAMYSCIKSRGPTRWDVSTIYNITGLERLSVVEDRLSLSDEGYEVRAVSIPGMLPMLSPLIIGSEDAYLAFGQESHFRVRSGVHVHGKVATEFIAEYFSRLWNFGEDSGENGGKIYRLKEEGRPKNDLALNLIRQKITNAK
ncbi:MAG TPA: hypothetical protein VGJ06_00395 [Candidatus Acidoferrum sp.]|jgi:hypothetical protein